MSYYSYFESEKNIPKDAVDSILEEVDIRGFSVAEGVLSAEKLCLIRKNIDDAWIKQVAETGEEKLKAYGEWGTVRALLDYHFEFSELIRDPLAMEVVSRSVGATAILHLMNGSIAFPSHSYHQSKLHRDFAKNFMSDKLLSINAFWVIDRFDPKTGGTWFVPYTHKIAYTPSDAYLEKYAVQTEADAGAVIFFDSRIYHRAGFNHTDQSRRGINFQYTKPFIKQQMDFPAMFAGRIDLETPLAQTLGLWAIPPKNLKEFRVDPKQRTYRGGQG